MNCLKNTKERWLFTLSSIIQDALIVSKCTTGEKKYSFMQHLIKLELLTAEGFY